MGRVPRKIKWTVVTVAVLIASLIVARYIAIVEPDTPFGTIMFRWRYSTATDKASFLRSFESELGKYNGWYVPKSIDSYLVSRLTSSAAQDEIEAIAMFYAVKGGQRTTNGIVGIPDSAKQRIVPLVIDNLGSLATWDAMHAVMFVDELRIGHTHFKTSLIDATKKNGLPPNMEYEDWLARIGLPEAEGRLRNWWDAPGESWTVKASRNPFEGSFLEIVGP